jgi:hypothetical protein
LDSVKDSGVVEEIDIAEQENINRDLILKTKDCYDYQESKNIK